MNDFLQDNSIFSQGYGTISKKVMRDPKITRDAKSIYSYICSFAGAGATAFPSVKLMCSELGFKTEDAFRKHRKMLVDSGYIKIHQRKRKDGKQMNNVYELIYTPTPVQPTPVQPTPVQPTPVQPTPVQPTPVKQGCNNNNTTNNSIINNNLNKSSSSNSVAGTNVFSFYENNFGVLNPFIAQNIESWINDTNEELVIAAMERALKQQKQWKYAEGILKKWVNDNIRTLTDVEAKEAEFARKKETKPKAQAKKKTVEKGKKWNSAGVYVYNPEDDDDEPWEG